MGNEHTPTPWRAEGPDQFGDYNILHSGDALAVAAVVSNLRSPETVAANTRRIVTAVNNHDKMLGLLVEWEQASILDTDCAKRTRALLKRIKEQTNE